MDHYCSLTLRHLLFQENPTYNNNHTESITTKEAFNLLQGRAVHKDLVTKEGNIQFVELEKEGKSNSMFIEANPQFKKINLYDSDIKLIPKENLDQYKSVNVSPVPKIEEKQAPDKKKEMKQEVKPEQSKNNVQKVTKSLLPKKKVTHKKGLSIG